jgi:hypothetical protein
MKKRVTVELDTDDVDRFKEFGMKLSPTLRFLMKWYLNTGAHDPKMPMFLIRPCKRTRSTYKHIADTYTKRKDIALVERDFVNAVPFEENVAQAILEAGVDAEGVKLFGYVTGDMCDMVYKIMINKGIATSRDAVLVAMEDYFGL